MSRHHAIKRTASAARAGLRALYGVIIIVLIAVGGLVAVSALRLPGGYQLFNVTSGSMEPAIHVGSAVLVLRDTSYRPGDIITVRSSNTATVTHRIVSVEGNIETPYYITKGDANAVADSDLRLPGNVIGRVYMTVPYMGYVLSFTRTRQGLLFLIILPSVLIIAAELVSIRDEAIRLLRERKKRLTALETAELAVGKEEIAAEHMVIRVIGRLRKSLQHPFRHTGVTTLLIIVLGVTISAIRPTGAQFTSTITSPGQFFAATWPVAIFRQDPDAYTVSFAVYEIQNYPSVTYAIMYKTAGGQNRGMTGSHTIADGETSFSRTGLYLGTCSAGGTCTPDSGITDLKLTVTLAGPAGTKTLIRSL